MTTKLIQHTYIGFPACCVTYMCTAIDRNYVHIKRYHMQCLTCLTALSRSTSAHSSCRNLTQCQTIIIIILYTYITWLTFYQSQWIADSCHRERVGRRGLVLSDAALDKGWGECPTASGLSLKDHVATWAPHNLPGKSLHGESHINKTIMHG